MKTGTLTFNLGGFHQYCEGHSILWKNTMSIVTLLSAYESMSSTVQGYHLYYREQLVLQGDIINTLRDNISTLEKV